MPFIGNKPTAVPLSGDDIQDGTIGLADLSATGTKDATTFLRGDNSFQTVSSYADSDALSLFNASGSAPVYACRAWINFDGGGVVAIRANGNVSSITDNGTGDYTVNFTTAMPDANYTISGSANVSTTLDAGQYSRDISLCSQTLSTSSFRIRTAETFDADVFDPAIVTLMVVR